MFSSGKDGSNRYGLWGGGFFGDRGEGIIVVRAGKQWRTDVFVNNGDIYCASASAMFGVPIEKHGQNAELSQKGKIAELAGGYTYTG